MTLTLPKIGGCYFVYVKDFVSKADAVMFQFDTGALVSLVGLNSICGEDVEECRRLKKIIKKHIEDEKIEKFSSDLKTVTRETIEAYPCVCSGVSIAGANPIDFYFHICLNRISFPLLGIDYIDDCSFTHSMHGKIEITAIAADAGKRMYDGSLLDFRGIMHEFNDKGSE